MRVLVAANLTPFIRGGAQDHIEGLCEGLRVAGHSVECLQMPFAFNPHSEVQRAMQACAALNLTAPSGQSIDRLIALQFPTWAIEHPEKVVWVMHQHRVAYELFPEQAGAPDHALRDEVQAFDQQHLGPLAQAGRLFANSRRVAERLQTFNGLVAKPLYHPPPDADRYAPQPAEPVVFFPSRFESLKRQLLLIEAARHMRSSLNLVLAGEGGQFLAAKQRVEALGLGERVRLLGRISAAEKRLWLARCMAVAYLPRDEDYGYVTLEAMASGKPLLVCTDAGGPLEFVDHEETGWVVPPEPQALAQALDGMAQNPVRAVEMGQAGLSKWKRLQITWPRVVERLLAA
ncbi:GT4_PimA-like domain containing protein [Burkholderiales bacterium]